MRGTGTPSRWRWPVKVVVVGSGGREHGLAEVLARTAEVVVTPGNPAIPGSVATAAGDLDADLFVIGPEQPLVDGLADRLRAQGKRVFGPGADGAELEGSKAFMKELVTSAGVPTARYGAFTELEGAMAFLDTLPGSFVVKTDGLAAGKGVLVTSSRAEAERDVRAKLSGSTFGDAGRRVVIEEELVGPEVSLFAICDGSRAVALDPAQDFKRVRDGDAGPNTGGMGAWSPLPFLPAGFADDVLARFVEPTLAALQARGIDYRGVLYAGLILTDQGPKLIEYNVRFGDPDSQPVLLRLTSDLAALLAAAADGDVGSVAPPTFSADTTVLVVAASEGYPTAPRTGDVIDGIAAARAVEGATVLAAGVSADHAGQLVTAGGRVLDVIGRGPDVATARRRAYDALAHISWPGEHHRTDIAAVPAPTKPEMA
ncbi:MAG: phosphoribosylamine--glycine ligase [Acidimicrobiales bacterium]|nr:phosphoribosylamine--glycine ligase [Acidimicrobiales bacterium]